MCTRLAVTANKNIANDKKHDKLCTQKIDLVHNATTQNKRSAIVTMP